MVRLIDIRSDSSRVVVVAENVAYFDIDVITGRDGNRYVRLRVFFMMSGKDLAFHASKPETVTSMLTGIMGHEEIEGYIKRLSEKE